MGDEPHIRAERRVVVAFRILCSMLNGRPGERYGGAGFGKRRGRALGPKRQPVSENGSEDGSQTTADTPGPRRFGGDTPDFFKTRNVRAHLLRSLNASELRSAGPPVQDAARRFRLSAERFVARNSQNRRSVGKTTSSSSNDAYASMGGRCRRRDDVPFRSVP